jgi:hypothetical protein
MTNESSEYTDDNQRYGYSKLTDTWYILHDWERLEGEKVVAKSKEEVPREEVPQKWIDATDERPVDTDTE